MSEIPVRLLHCVDHDGTIQRLIRPLAAYSGDVVLASFGEGAESAPDRVPAFAAEAGMIPILHATGSDRPFYRRKEEWARLFPRVYLFFHVSPAHFHTKGRHEELRRLSRLVAGGQFLVLTPSPEVSRLYKKAGIPSQAVQLGVDVPIDVHNTEPDLVTTVCSSADACSRWVKGIDRFCRIVRDAGLASQALIMGHDAPALDGIRRRALGRPEFLRLLARTRVYVQLSRSEAYNLTAVEAKRLGVPVIVSHVEGHCDNVLSGFQVHSEDEARELLQRIYRDRNSPGIRRAVEENRRDSLGRETIPQFHRSLCAALAP